MVYLHKPSNCFILSNIFLRHKQRWKRCSNFLEINLIRRHTNVFTKVFRLFLRECINIRELLILLNKNKTSISLNKKTIFANHINYYY